VIWFSRYNVPVLATVNPWYIIILSCTGVPKQLVSGSGVVFSGLTPGIVIKCPEAGAGINSVLIVLIGFVS
jgi:hypothetical protein